MSHRSEAGRAANTQPIFPDGVWKNSNAGRCVDEDERSESATPRTASTPRGYRAATTTSATTARRTYSAAVMP